MVSKMVLVLYSDGPSYRTRATYKELNRTIYLMLGPASNEETELAANTY